MQAAWKRWLLAAALAWGIPWVMMGVLTGLAPQPTTESTVSTTRTLQETTAPLPMTITVLIDGKELDMALSDYLTGVLLGELPSSFHMEAKKAQAVVARTYTLRTIASMDKHNGAICTDSRCCQAYMNPDACRNPQAVVQAKQAVGETADMVLTYGGELILATYFSCSGGYTEDAVAVWGGDVPYLQAVESPGEEQAYCFTDRVTFSAQEFQRALGVSLSGSPATWFGGATYTEGGGVNTMKIGGRVYKGTDLRQLLGLRSTVFTVTTKENTIIVDTKGYGHRVGMSQYGAQAMALAGKGYREILSHYYLNTILSKIEDMV